MSQYRFTSRPEYTVSIWPALCAVILLTTCLLGWSQSAHAQANIFEVRDVEVDATAASAAKARDKALAAGQRAAFARLLQRLTLREDHTRLPNPDSDTIATYIQDFSVSDEKTSNVRYLAKLHVRFKTDDIRSLLKEFGLRHAETASKPVLVIPVLEQSGVLSLWEDHNTWRHLWMQMTGSDSLVPLSHPIGDLVDIGMIGARHAITDSEERLRAIMARYNANAAIIAHAVLNATATDGTTRLDVYVTQYGMGDDGQTRALQFTDSKGQPPEQLLAQGVAETVTFIDDSWKSANLMHAGRRGVLAVSVPIKGLPDWLGMRQRIDGIAIIERMEVVLLSREEARVNLHFIGSADQVALALAQKDLQLNQIQGVWSISAVQP